jgi:hypothetical protein
MDYGQFIYIISRLGLGGMAAILAIALWPKTRDAARAFLIIGALLAYIGVVYDILGRLGITQGLFIQIGQVELPKLILDNLPPVFFAIAFGIMLKRKH